MGLRIFFIVNAIFGEFWLVLSLCSTYFERWNCNLVFICFRTEIIIIIIIKLLLGLHLQSTMRTKNSKNCFTHTWNHLKWQFFFLEISRKMISSFLRGWYFFFFYFFSLYFILQCKTNCFSIALQFHFAIWRKENGKLNKFAGVLLLLLLPFVLVLVISLCQMHELLCYVSIVDIIIIIIIMKYVCNLHSWQFVLSHQMMWQKYLISLNFELFSN